ncbi:site-specific tyrosine recombinase XerC [Phycisphaerae bacterium RAS1]|nr:site-specific tyrosine recombinase XerC [Phycisphaerae bacterium RAS1]
MTNHRRRRIPKLQFTKLRDIGWHVAFRDSNTGTPRRIRFGNIEKAEAEAKYHAWLGEHLHLTNGNGAAKPPEKKLPPVIAEALQSVVPGSLLSVATQVFEFDEARTRKPGEPRAKGTLDAAVAADRKAQLDDFLDFMTRKHGNGALARMRLSDLTMGDVETFNREIVKKGYSASQVSKRLQLIKAMIDRAGRPENGLQRLEWNWDSRDVLHGKPSKKRSLPTVEQLKKILRACDARERAMVWMAIGLGFGQSDLAEVRAGQIDEESYDLRRGKTGIERYGSTPPLVWKLISEYLKLDPRPAGEPLFISRRGQPLTHGKGDSVQQWWYKLRKRIDETPQSLTGFYVLRHLGATEFGSRPQCSIGDIKRWLGHAASSHIADLYMKPVSPEYRPVVEWVRNALLTGKVDLRTDRKKGAIKGTSTSRGGSEAAQDQARD